MKKLKQCFIIVVLTFSLAALTFTERFAHFLETPLPISAPGKIFVIKPGVSVYNIATALTAIGIIDSPWYFLCLVKKEGVWKHLRAGEYLIPPNITPGALVRLFSSGKVVQHAITIVPGWNFEQLMQVINQSPHLKHTLNEFTPEMVMAALGHPGEHPEGRFLPDTYYFPVGISDVVFLKRAYGMLKTKLDRLWEGRINKLPLRSPFEALILASIVEKESSLTSEYAEIAGVYVRRLERKMRLQADPTVIYGAGKAFTGRVTRQILSHPTPYNTYLNKGLPPTPIAMPSEQALQAVLHPLPGKTLYFVAHSSGKGHVFSKDLAAHQVAVKQYRQSLEKQKKVGS